MKRLKKTRIPGKSTETSTKVQRDVETVTRDKAELITEPEIGNYTSFERYRYRNRRESQKKRMLKKAADIDEET
jgi:hypothetical protein